MNQIDTEGSQITYISLGIGPVILSEEIESTSSPLSRPLPVIAKK
jgi:hypothetical protein